MRDPPHVREVRRSLSQDVVPADERQQESDWYRTAHPASVRIILAPNRYPLDAPVLVSQMF